MTTINTLLSFQDLLKQFNKVERDCESINDLKGFDNDVEHSYRVAMLCWMLVENYKLDLDVSKILKYALVHDLPEVYAGDVSIYSNISAAEAEKEVKEKIAIDTLQSNYPSLHSMWSALDDYENKIDAESKFVYLVEKLEPTALLCLSAPDHYRHRNISYDFFKNKKLSKIKDINSFAQVFVKDMFEYLEENKSKYFDK